MSVKRIKNLVKQLNEYRHAYYNQDAPLVSDAEYDRLFDELKELEEQTGFILSNSPTQTVGYYPVSELAKGSDCGRGTDHRGLLCMRF